MEKINSIEDANVSDSWKHIFQLFEKIGADKISLTESLKSSEYKELKFTDKRKVTWNFLAFLFSCLYYFSKKMWYKGAFLLSVNCLLVSLLILFENITGATVPIFVFMALGSIYASLASYDYYRLVIYGEKFWKGFPQLFSKPVGAISCVIVNFFVGIAVSMSSPEYQMLAERNIQTKEAVDVSGVWRASKDGAMLTIDLISPEKSIDIQGIKLSTLIKDVDLENQIISLDVSRENSPAVVWVLRKLYNETEDGFTLQITTNDGIQDELSFVRNL